MFPYLYQSSSITIGTYGVMLAIAYLVGRYFYIERLNQVSEKPVNTELLIISLLIFGVIGAKLLFVLKNPERASLTDWSSLTSGSGFSSQGAIIAAILVTVSFAKLSKLRLNDLLDSAAFPAIVAYALARIGCFLAGDDCYGIKTDLPWGMSFPHGVAETHDTVHPLPLYEVVYSLVIAYILFKQQKLTRPPYYLFFLLLITWGFCRFWIEFISTNPDKLLGMSGSQFGALLMFLAGSAYMISNYLFTGKKKPGK